MIIVCNSNHSQPFLTNARMLLKKLNDDVLSYLLGWLEGFDVSNCRLVCKRLYNLTESHHLWHQVAEATKAASLPLPFYFGDDLENVPLPYLRRVTTRACRLHHNLTFSGVSQLYKWTIIDPSWDPRPWKKIAREVQMDVFSGFVYIFDGRWIISRRKDYLSFRHISSTRWKDKFDIPVIEFTEWQFLLSQVDRDVALIAMFHYPTRQWHILEAMLGKTKNDAPKTRNIDIGEAKGSLALVGRRLIAYEFAGSVTIMDVYSNNRLALGQFRKEATRYCIADNIMFSAYSTLSGRIYITAYRLGGQQNLVEPHTRTTHSFTLGKDVPAADAHTLHEVAYICPSTSCKSALTIWHTLRKKNDKVTSMTVQFTVELPYNLPDGLEGGDKCVTFGHRVVRSTRLPPGNHFIGVNGLSSVVTQYNRERASIWVYPRLSLPLGYNSRHLGKALPLPNKACSAMKLNEVRVTWDDARGIAVLVFHDGGMWILHYA